MDPFAGGALKLGQLGLKQRYTHILEYAYRGLGEKQRQLLSWIAALSDSADAATVAVLNPFLPPRPEKVEEPEDPFGGYEWRLLQRRLRQAEDDHAREKVEAEMQAYLETREPDFRVQREAYERYQDAVRAYPHSPEYRKALSAFDEALKELENRGLVQWDRDTNTYDLHPVVRAYAYEQLEDRDRTQAHDTLRDHFASLPPDNYAEATELEHLKNSIALYRALVGAGRFDDAAEFYTGEFARTLLFTIGARHTTIELLKPLFRGTPDGLPALTSDRSKSYILNDFAIALRALARIIHTPGFRLDVGRNPDELGQALGNPAGYE
jgi:hypothetical protein